MAGKTLSEKVWDAHVVRKGEMEARIRQIEQMLKDATLVEDDAVFEAVAVGCVLKIRYDGDDDAETYFYGSIEEKRPGMASLSPSSPLGVALAGKKVGDHVTYQAPGGMLGVEIVEIGG